MFVILVTEEYDHARQWKWLTCHAPHVLEQRQARGWFHELKAKRRTQVVRRRLWKGGGGTGCGVLPFLVGNAEWRSMFRLGAYGLR
jgi:hypothetical protein